MAITPLQEYVMSSSRMPTQKPTVGRIVHYHPHPDRDWALPSYGAPLAAIVAREEPLVLAVIDPDGAVPIMRIAAPEHSETPAPGCWSWPPRV